MHNTIVTQVEKTSAGALIASHTYSYDPNLNPVQDVSTVQNADNHAAMVANTATDTYTPRPIRSPRSPTATDHTTRPTPTTWPAM